MTEYMIIKNQKTNTDLSIPLSFFRRNYYIAKPFSTIEIPAVRMILVDSTATFEYILKYPDPLLS